MTSDPGLRIVSICGSLRAKSYNAALVRTLPQLAPGSMRFVAGPSIANLPHYDFDLQQSSGPASAAAELGQEIRYADALVIVSPEYNYSLPGVLKNAIDWLSRLPQQPLKDKPVLIQSVSAGLLGGARMQYHLRQILVALDAHVFTRPEVMIGLAAAKFDEDGLLTDEPTRRLVQAQLAAFAAFVATYAPRPEPS